MQRLVSPLLLLAVLVSLANPVQAGTAANPEIIDDASDSDILTGEIIPHLEITKGWIEPKGERFHFNMEVAALDEVPQDAVYVFHYTFDNLRLYFRANHTDDGELRFFGGVYEGVKGPNSFDPQGNRNYAYFPGNPNQTERIRGSIDTGAPGRITWSYPMDSYAEDRRGLTFKGLFLSAYQKTDEGSLQIIDTGLTENDYLHEIYTPWYAKFIPGPSPAMLLAGLGAAAIAVQGVRRRQA